MGEPKEYLHALTAPSVSLFFDFLQCDHRRRRMPLGETLPVLDARSDPQDTFVSLERHVRVSVKTFLFPCCARQACSVNSQREGAGPAGCFSGPCGHLVRRLTSPFRPGPGFRLVAWPPGAGAASPPRGEPDCELSLLLVKNEVVRQLRQGIRDLEAKRGHF